MEQEGRAERKEHRDTEKKKRFFRGHEKPSWQFLFLAGKFQAMLFSQTLSQPFRFAS